VVVDDGALDAVVDAIRDAAITGKIGDDKIRVTRWTMPCACAPASTAPTRSRAKSANVGCRAPDRAFRHPRRHCLVAG
jgi:hypothetical protein